MGKTATLVIGVLGRINSDIDGCQALFITPTREQAHAVEKLALACGDHARIKSYAIGVHGRDVIHKLKDEGQHLVIGTPGRIYDVISKRHIGTGCLRALVLDEADEILARGFKDQVCDIFKQLPLDIQVCLTSATMPPEVLELTTKFMRGAVQIDLPDHEELTLEFVKHFYIDIEKEEWKLDTLCDLFETIDVPQAVVFCNSRRKVDFLAEEMQKRGFTAAALHAELDQVGTDRVLRDFRSGAFRLLVSADVARLQPGVSRRLGDVQHVAMVVNYD